MAQSRFLITAAVWFVTAFSAVAGSPYTSRGITADGRVIIAPPNAHRPWASDMLNDVRPKMPASLRARHAGGQALCRVVLNVAAGTVRDVIIVKSSGYAALDASIKQALRQWKLRPGKWKEFEIYVGVWSSPDGASR